MKMRYLAILVLFVGCVPVKQPDANSKPISAEQVQANQAKVDAAIAEASKPQCTQERFNQLELGMTPEEVMDIIGPPSATIWAHDNDKAYKWRGPGGRGVANLVFRDGKLASLGCAMLP